MSKIKEFELFTVTLKENGVVGIVFNEELLQIISQEELFAEMSSEMEQIKPIANKIFKLIKNKL